MPNNTKNNKGFLDTLKIILQGNPRRFDHSYNLERAAMQVEGYKDMGRAYKEMGQAGAKVLQGDPNRYSHASNLARAAALAPGYEAIGSGIATAVKMPITGLDKIITTLDKSITAMAVNSIKKDIEKQYKDQPELKAQQLARLDALHADMNNESDKLHIVEKITDQNAFKIALGSALIIGGGPVGLVGGLLLGVKSAIVVKDAVALNRHNGLVSQYNTILSLCNELMERQTKLETIKARGQELPEAFYKQLVSYKGSDEQAKHTPNSKLANTALVLDLANAALSLTKGAVIYSDLENLEVTNPLEDVNASLAGHYAVKSLKTLPESIKKYDLRMEDTINKLNEIKNKMLLGNKDVTDLNQIYAKLQAENAALDSMIQNPVKFGLEGQELNENQLIEAFQKERGRNLDYKPFQSGEGIIDVPVKGLELLGRSLFQKTDLYNKEKIQDGSQAIKDNFPLLEQIVTTMQQEQIQQEQMRPNNFVDRINPPDEFLQSR